MVFGQGRYTASRSLASYFWGGLAGVLTGYVKSKVCASPRKNLFVEST